MEVTFLKAAEHDADALVAIRNEALAFKLLHDDKAWDEAPFTRQEMLDAIAPSTQYIVLANNQPAASFVLHWHDEHGWGERGLDGTAGYIGSLAVGERFRGKQLGKRMIDWAASESSRIGKHVVRLDCPANNSKLCRYYENLKFEPQGINAYAMTLYERAI